MLVLPPQVRPRLVRVGDSIHVVTSPEKEGEAKQVSPLPQVSQGSPAQNQALPDLSSRPGQMSTRKPGGGTGCFRVPFVIWAVPVFSGGWGNASECLRPGLRSAIIG